MVIILCVLHSLLSKPIDSSKKQDFLNNGDI